MEGGFSGYTQYNTVLEGCQGADAGGKMQNIQIISGHVDVYLKNKFKKPLDKNRILQYNNKAVRREQDCGNELRVCWNWQTG